MIKLFRFLESIKISKTQKYLIKFRIVYEMTINFTAYEIYD